MEFGEMFAQLANPSRDLRVLSANVLWVAFSLPVVGLFVYRLRRAQLPQVTQRLMWGVVLVGLVTAARGGYWAPWRYFLHHGQEENARWFVENAIWMDAATIILCIGYTLHILPALQGVFGRGWWLMPIGYGLFWYVASFAVLI